MAERGFNQKRNYDDVWLRSVLTGAVNTLTNTVSFTDQISEDEFRTVEVPVFFPLSGNERFLQDFYLREEDCDKETLLGNYDKIPRGVLIPDSISIRTADLTNPFVYGHFFKEEEGVLKAYRAPINFLPITVPCELKYKADSYLNTFKIVQSLIEETWSALHYNIIYRGMTVPSRMGISENFTTDKLAEFTSPDSDENLITVDIEIETYLPIIDRRKATPASQSIKEFEVNIKDCSKDEILQTIIVDESDLAALNNPGDDPQIYKA